PCRRLASVVLPRPESFSLKHIGDYVGHRSAPPLRSTGRSPSSSCVRSHSAMGRTCYELRWTFPELPWPRDREVPRLQARVATALCCRREDAGAARRLVSKNKIGSRGDQAWC